MRSLVSLASLAVGSDIKSHSKIATLPLSIQMVLLRELNKFSQNVLDASLLCSVERTSLQLHSGLFFASIVLLSFSPHFPFCFPLDLVNDDVVNAIASFPMKTQDLRMTETNVGFYACRRLAISLAQSLCSLDISQSLCSGLLNAFSRCSLLRTVKCDDSLVLRDREVQTILQRCVVLQELSLRRCRNLTDRSFAKMQRCYLLRLDVREVRGLTDASLHKIAACCPTLLALSLEGQRLQGAGLTDVLNCCKQKNNLSFVVVSETNRDLRFGICFWILFINSGTELEALYIPLITIDNPDELLRIRNTSVKIRQLDLFGSILPENTLLFLFGNVFRNLRKLNVSGVRHLSFEVTQFCLRFSLKREVVVNLFWDVIYWFDECVLNW
jgi:hypothetical protein